MLDNAHRQDIVTRTPITRVELITTRIVGLIIRSIWHQSTADFCVLENFRHTFVNLWRHLPTEVRNVYCVVKYIHG